MLPGKQVTQQSGCIKEYKMIIKKQTAILKTESSREVINEKLPCFKSFTNLFFSSPHLYIKVLNSKERIKTGWCGYGVYDQFGQMWYCADDYQIIKVWAFDNGIDAVLLQ